MRNKCWYGMTSLPNLILAKLCQPCTFNIGSNNNYRRNTTSKQHGVHTQWNWFRHEIYPKPPSAGTIHDFYRFVTSWATCARPAAECGTNVGTGWPPFLISFWQNFANPARLILEVIIITVEIRQVNNMEFIPSGIDFVTKFTPSHHRLGRFISRFYHQLTIRIKHDGSEALFSIHVSNAGPNWEQKEKKLHELHCCTQFSCIGEDAASNLLNLSRENRHEIRTQLYSFIVCP